MGRCAIRQGKCEGGRGCPSMLARPQNNMIILSRSIFMVSQRWLLLGLIFRLGGQG